MAPYGYVVLWIFVYKRDPCFGSPLCLSNDNRMCNINFNHIYIFPSRQSGRHLADDFFKCSFVNGMSAVGLKLIRYYYQKCEWENNKPFPESNSYLESNYKEPSFIILPHVFYTLHSIACMRSLAIILSSFVHNLHCIYSIVVVYCPDWAKAFAVHTIWNKFYSTLYDSVLFSTGKTSNSLHITSQKMQM